jgi:hypothetical protein
MEWFWNCATPIPYLESFQISPSVKIMLAGMKTVCTFVVSKRFGKQKLPRDENANHRVSKMERVRV